jgi:hypothetical protein
MTAAEDACPMTEIRHQKPGYFFAVEHWFSPGAACVFIYIVRAQSAQKETLNLLLCDS